MVGRRLIHAATIADSRGSVSPGAVLLNGHMIEAMGSPAAIGEVTDATRETYSSGIVMPGLINAHCHLDLSGLGPIPCDDGFEAWLNEIMIRRPTTPTATEAGAQRGVELALEGGTVAVGDIGGAGSWASHAVLERSPLRGIVWVEVFGIGNREPKGIEAVAQLVERAGQQAGRISIGVSPHAPYSCGPGLYRAAAHSGLPVATHLAETLDEVEFCLTGAGPFGTFLAKFGIDCETIPALGEHPLEAYAELMSSGWTLAHVNYPSTVLQTDEERANCVARLAQTGATVAYCPRASAFFGHSGHPWRELLAAGVPVALGTDSLCCLDTPKRISVVDELRWIIEKDGATLDELLPMATTNGARVVGIDPGLVDLQPGPVAAILLVDLGGEDQPEWILPPEKNETRHASLGRYNPLS